MSRMDHLLSAAILIGGLLFALPAGAASGTVMTSSGSTTGSGSVHHEESHSPGAGERIRAVASMRSTTVTRTLLTNSLEKRDAFQMERRDAGVRMRQHLQDCHEELRRANRDQKVPVTLRCYRGRLMLELTWLRKQAQWIGEDKSVNVEVKKAAVDTTDALIEGIAAIVTGIDSNVYDDEAGLREAKTLLHSQYRLRQWTAVLHADGDRLLSWVLLLADDATEHVPANDNGMFAPWNAAAECLENSVGWLMQVKQATTYDDALAAWTSARSEVASCTIAMKTAMKTPRVMSSTGSVLP